MEQTNSTELSRIDREKEAYDLGDVHSQSSALQNRFHHVFSCPNSRRAENWYEDKIKAFARGARVLDYGCYDGWLYPQLSQKQPASITGIDISEKGISLAKARYGEYATYIVMDAHKLDFPDDSFDFVVGRSILHHLDFEVAVSEIRRVLSPKGACLFYEPLLDNPAAKLLRLLTPRARTRDQKPLTRSQLDWLATKFDSCDFRFINMASVPVAMMTSLLRWPADNVLLKITDRLDEWVSQTSLRYWFRQVAFCCGKSG